MLMMKKETFVLNFIKLTHFYADTFASNVSTMESVIVTELVEKYDPNIAPPT